MIGSSEVQMLVSPVGGGRAGEFACQIKKGAGRIPHLVLISICLFYQVGGGYTDRFGGFIFLGDSMT